jgi:hypothetical protein
MRWQGTAAVCVTAEVVTLSLACELKSVLCGGLDLGGKPIAAVSNERAKERRRGPHKTASFTEARRAATKLNYNSRWPAIGYLR